MAELWTLQQTRPLTREEQNEMNICLHFNTNYARKLAELHNLSLAASMVQDIEWQHEICGKIEQLECDYRVEWPKSRRSPDTI
jgi:hypothetical protein